MVEQLMFFALGFFVAGFIAVLLTPALNQRAERLANRRMRALFPVSLEEMTAERDHLRAEFAVTTRTMERKQERMLDDKAAALGEVGKQLSFVNAVKRQFDEAQGKLSTLEASHADLRTDLDNARKELGAATADRDDARVELEALTAQRDLWTRDQTVASKRVEGQRVAIAELENRIAAISAAASDSQKRADRLADERQDERSGVRALQETLANHRANAARLTERIAALEKSRDDVRSTARTEDALNTDIRILRERLAKAQEDNDMLRKRMSVQAAGPVATAPTAAWDDAGSAGVQDAVAALQTDIARLRPDDKSPVAGELRRRIADVAHNIMANTQLEPEAPPPGARIRRDKTSRPANAGKGLPKSTRKNAV